MDKYHVLQVQSGSAGTTVLQAVFGCSLATFTWLTLNRFVLNSMVHSPDMSLESVTGFTFRVTAILDTVLSSQPACLALAVAEPQELLDPDCLADISKGAIVHTAGTAVLALAWCMALPYGKVKPFQLPDRSFPSCAAQVPIPVRTTTHVLKHALIVLKTIQLANHVGKTEEIDTVLDILWVYLGPLIHLCSKDATATDAEERATCLLLVQVLMPVEIQLYGHKNATLLRLCLDIQRALLSLHPEAVAAEIAKEGQLRPR